MRALLKPCDPGPLALGLLVLAALAVAFAGFEHARLFHRGYASVEIVGPLFILNALGSTVVVLMLVFGRVWLFVLGALSIVVPSLISIYLSHTSGFFGFREGGYGAEMILIVAAEIAATALVVIGGGLAFGACRGAKRLMSAMRAALAAVVVIAMGAAIAGVAMGEAPAESAPAPSPAEIAAAEQRIAAGGTAVRTGRRAFEDAGCDRCHSIAAIGADGKLGPRLDTLDEDTEDIAEAIVDPRDDIVDGYSAELMPTDYAERRGADVVAALARFIATASGVQDDAGQGRGRGRGRGRSGRDGGDDRRGRNGDDDDP